MKVQFLEYPVLAPSKCSLCGGNHKRDGRQYADFGLTIRNYGVVYICTMCIIDLVGSLGWINPAVAEDLNKELGELKGKLILLEEENDRLRNSLANLDFLGTRTPDDPDIVETTLADIGVEEPTDNKSGDGKQQSEGNKSGSNKSPDEPRSTGVHRSEFARSI